MAPFPTGDVAFDRNAAAVRYLPVAHPGGAEATVAITFSGIRTEQASRA